MREITINDRVFKIRALTPAEIRELNAAGLPVYRFGVDYDQLNNARIAQETADGMYSKVFSAEDIAAAVDSGHNGEKELFAAIVRETWGSPDEAKN
jgi:hypothetical protein